MRLSKQKTYQSLKDGGETILMGVSTHKSSLPKMLGMRQKLCGNRRLRFLKKLWIEVFKEIMDATAKDSDRAYALLRWVETEMRYAGWNTRINDQHGRTDVYEAIVGFLK